MKSSPERLDSEMCTVELKPHTLSLTIHRVLHIERIDAVATFYSNLESGSVALPAVFQGNIMCAMVLENIFIVKTILGFEHQSDGAFWILRSVRRKNQALNRLASNSASCLVPRSISVSSVYVEGVIQKDIPSFTDCLMSSFWC